MLMSAYEKCCWHCEWSLFIKLYQKIYMVMVMIVKEGYKGMQHVSEGPHMYRSIYTSVWFLHVNFKYLK